MPLLKDYFWNIILDQRDWQLLCKAVAIHAQNQLTSCDEDSEDFIHYCTMAYRLYLLSNSLAEAESLKYYYKGEFREAALKLYHAKEYELSLKYVDTYLHLNPQDKRMKFLKVRCLTRLEKYHIAELELRDLEELGYPLYLIAHARGMIYRDQGSIEKAIKEFQKGLDIRKDYLPLLRDYGDLLERIGDYEGALSVLECAFSIQPRDRFVVPKYVSILEKIGDLKSAFSIMSDLVITFPYEASFRHRLSMIYSQLGDDDKAYEEATIAVSLDSHLYEAVLHLASLEIKKEDYTQAEVLLNTLPAKIPNRTKQIRDTIRAELLIRDNKFEAARQIFRQYRHISDSYCYFVMAKIELKDARQDLERENIDLAKGKLEKGLDYCKNGLKLSPSDYRLNVLLKEIESILDLI